MSGRYALTSERRAEKLSIAPFAAVVLHPGMSRRDMKILADEKFAGMKRSHH